MTQLDLKKLSKGMNIKDKMRLLFEDMNRRSETAGKEFVLTPQERKAIVDDARNTGEMTEIRRVNELYRTAMFISIDMEIAQLCLCLSISQLEKILVGIMCKDAAEDIVGRILYDSTQQHKQTSGSIENQIEKLWIQHRAESKQLNDFDLFSQLVTEDHQQMFEPNQKIQLLFMATFIHAKKLKKKLHELSYVVEKAPIDFLPQYAKKLRKESEDILTAFSDLDKTLRPLRVYRDYGVKFAPNAQLIEPQFFEVIQVVNKQLELSADDKNELERKIDKFLSDDLY